MSREPMDDVVERLREEYHVPPETPREPMWQEIEARIIPRGVIPIEGATRKARRFWPAVGWAAAAALVVGMGIGRLSMTTSTTWPLATGPDAGLLRAAALDHLGRTESLLTLVRADGRSGRVDPAVGAWARSLLTQTRLLLDRPEAGDPSLRGLLEDLELVLVQIVGVSDAEGGDEARARSELTLALEGIEEREVLPRIQAVIPAGSGLAGT